MYITQKSLVVFGTAEAAAVWLIYGVIASPLYHLYKQNKKAT